MAVGARIFGFRLVRIWDRHRTKLMPLNKVWLMFGTTLSVSATGSPCVTALEDHGLGSEGPRWEWGGTRFESCLCLNGLFSRQAQPVLACTEHRMSDGSLGSIASGGDIWVSAGICMLDIPVPGSRSPAGSSPPVATVARREKPRDGDSRECPYAGVDAALATTKGHVGSFW